MLSGSSPRMWGTPVKHLIITLLLRFIPTHVGNSRTWARWFSGRTVHPHACGELFSIAPLVFSIRGSSPRMWGTQRLTSQDGWGWRFIPTHVGNSIVNRPLSRLQPVHPHACGELIFNQILQIVSFGSSPRMWGTHFQPNPPNSQFRFIPTHVGNSSNQEHEWIELSVHPHACGELI